MRPLYGHRPRRPIPSRAQKISGGATRMSSAPSPGRYYPARLLCIVDDDTPAADGLGIARRACANVLARLVVVDHAAVRTLDLDTEPIRARGCAAAVRGLCIAHNQNESVPYHAVDRTLSRIARHAVITDHKRALIVD